jgi:uncharacterized protein (TIGR03118 family)
MRVSLCARPQAPVLAIAITAISAVLLVPPVAAGAQAGGSYIQRNLVSDLAGIARFQDPDLVNAWGLSHSPAGPWQVSDNGTGLATRYKGNGMGVPPVVTIPAPGGGPGGAPTGNVFNPTGGFAVSQGGVSGPGQFLFATEDGTISGWNPAVDPAHALIAVDRSGVRQGRFLGAVYKGLALAQSGPAGFLFATDFRFGVVEEFDAGFRLVRSFTDPALAADCPLPGQCFAPFGIQDIGGDLYVSFALQNKAHHDDVAGAGNGFVDVFGTSGTLIRRFASGGPLNSPWGLALAPAGFGAFSNDLLAGNFGDGRISAFDLATGAFLGQLQDPTGHPVTINGLWGLAFGNGGLAGDTTTLFFAAGLNDEADGLFGTIRPA